MAEVLSIIAICLTALNSAWNIYSYFRKERREEADKTEKRREKEFESRGRLEGEVYLSLDKPDGPRINARLYNLCGFLIRVRRVDLCFKHVPDEPTEPMPFPAEEITSIPLGRYIEQEIQTTEGVETITVGVEQSADLEARSDVVFHVPAWVPECMNDLDTLTCEDVWISVTTPAGEILRLQDENLPDLLREFVRARQVIADGRR